MSTILDLFLAMIPKPVAQGTAYYNEIEPDAVKVLRMLIEEGVIAPGHVDSRSIVDVHPSDLHGFAQCHFFAGGGLWSVAARLAGWPDSRPLWTGSCPCQPFSKAGKRLGTDDPRHLWPNFYRLIRARRPPVVMGEQVALKAGRDWFDGVSADMARDGYFGRTVDIPACAVDSPQKRNRLYWLFLGDAYGDGELQQARSELQGGGWSRDADVGCLLGDADSTGFQERQCKDFCGTGRQDEGGTTGQSDSPFRPVGQSWWSGAEWLDCRDGKARRGKPGIRMLADGLPGRVGLWRLAGNGINPILAAEVIAALLDTEGF